MLLLFTYYHTNTNQHFNIENPLHLTSSHLTIYPTFDAKYPKYCSYYGAGDGPVIVFINHKSQYKWRQARKYICLLSSGFDIGSWDWKLKHWKAVVPVLKIPILGYFLSKLKHKFCQYFPKLLLLAKSLPYAIAYCIKENILYFNFMLKTKYIYLPKLIFLFWALIFKASTQKLRIPESTPGLDKIVITIHNSIPGFKNFRNWHHHQ